LLDDCTDDDDDDDDDDITAVDEVVKEVDNASRPSNTKLITSTFYFN